MAFALPPMTGVSQQELQATKFRVEALFGGFRFGVQGSGVQGFRGSGVQGFRGSGVQGFRGSGV